MPINWIKISTWNNLLTLLNEKRTEVGKDEIEHTFSGWIKQSDINTLRNGTIEILPDYDYTLESALNEAGYDYATWKTWERNWIAQTSLDEIENILNLWESVEINDENCISKSLDQVYYLEDGEWILDWCVIDEWDYDHYYVHYVRWVSEGEEFKEVRRHIVQYNLEEYIVDIETIKKVTLILDAVTFFGEPENIAVCRCSYEDGDTCEIAVNSIQISDPIAIISPAPAGEEHTRIVINLPLNLITPEKTITIAFRFINDINPEITPSKDAHIYFVALNIVSKD